MLGLPTERWVPLDVHEENGRIERQKGRHFRNIGLYFKDQVQIMGILDPLMKVLNPRICLCSYEIYIYIYAFSRHFYPKRLTVHSGYTFFFISMRVPWELNPQPFTLLTQCSTTEPQKHWIHSKMPICCSKNRSMLKTVVLLNIFVETLVDFLGYDE